MIIEVNIFYTNTRMRGLFLFKMPRPEEEQQILISGSRGTSRVAMPGATRQVAGLDLGGVGFWALLSTGSPSGPMSLLAAVGLTV